MVKDSLYETPCLTRVSTIKDVRADAFIAAYAKHLKASGKFQCPQWVDIVKTSHAKELAPYNPDWLFVRAASILRRLYFRPHQGVGGLSKLYGSKKRRGAAPGHHVDASRGILRHCLKELEKMGLVEASTGGRKLTVRGVQEINMIARQCSSE